jgi:BMFP domain-containing protein YqiC
MAATARAEVETLKAEIAALKAQITPVESAAKKSRKSGGADA